MASDPGDLLTRMRTEAKRLFEVAVARVNPYEAVKRFVRLEGHRLMIGQEGRPEMELNLDTFHRIFLVGGGKATAPMAKAMEDLLGGRVERGLINVKYGFTEKLSHTVIQEAGHPVLLLTVGDMPPLVPLRLETRHLGGSDAWQRLESL